MKIAAVIPTRFYPPELVPLTDMLQADGVRVALRDSADYGHRIYNMWNSGLEGLAGYEYVAILNDDIRLLPGTLHVMAGVLRGNLEVGIVYPDVRAPFTHLPDMVALEETEGTWGAGGMTGFCFMFRVLDGLTRFDESYRWWYGDDDFEERMRLSGRKVCRVVGLPIVHTADGSAGKVWDELSPLIAQDRALWEERHR